VTSTPASDQRKAPLHLWRAASALLNTLFALFGGPEKLAAKHTLTAAAHKLASDWLRTAEALMRRLLLIEASAYPVPPASSRQRRKSARQRKLMSFDADKPENWRVSFRCILERQRPRRRGTEQHPQTSNRLNNAGGDAGAPRKLRRFLSAWPLAERFEALIRVHNDPAAYAKRLARRLRAAPKLIALMLRPLDALAHRVGDEIDAQLDALCERCTPLFNSS